MKETRAVQISFELWKDWITQGATMAGVRCIAGIPESAECVGVFYKDCPLGGASEMRVDLVLVFEGDDWATPPGKYTVSAPWNETYPLENIEFQLVECRTCKWWDQRSDLGGVDIGQCNRSVGGDAIYTDQLLTVPDFGCTQYEKVEEPTP